jgi:hypothetical protein
MTATIIPVEKQRKRIDAKPKKNLLSALKQNDPEAIQHALNMQDKSALAAVEEAIAVKRGNPDFVYYRPGGAFISSSSGHQDAMMKLILLAGGNNLLDDPAYTQSLIIQLGEQNNQLFIQLMGDNREAIYQYQLLGIQMQLAIMLDGLSDSKPEIMKYVLYSLAGMIIFVIIVYLVILLTSYDFKSNLSHKADLTVTRVNWDAWENMQYTFGGTKEFSYDPPPEGYKYILIESIIHNKSSKTIDYFDLPKDDVMYLIDEDGTIYSDYDTADSLPGILTSYRSSLASDSSDTWNYFFEVPSDANIVEFVVYGMHAELSEKSKNPPPTPVPYGETLFAENGMEIQIKDTAWGSEYGANYLWMSLSCKNSGNQPVRFDEDNSFYLVDDNGKIISYAGYCSGIDLNKEFFELNRETIQPGKTYSGETCFVHLDQNNNYFLIYNPVDGFTPNYTLLIGQE